jgi:metal-responsive CopG/Arc/MetJ family transcriptional regulator
MGKIIVTLTDKIEKELREMARTKYGNKRGALSIIVEEALKNYLSSKK